MFSSPFTDAALTPDPQPDPQPAGLDPHISQAFLEFAELTREERELDRRIKEINKRQGELEPILRDYLSIEGYQGVPVRVSGFSIFLRSQIWARAKPNCSQSQVCAILKACGMAHFVAERIETSPLSAHIRELEKRYQDDLASGVLTDLAEVLPPALAEVLSIEPTVSVVAQESKKK